MAAGCLAAAGDDERRDANVEKSISITTAPAPTVVIGTVAASHQPRLRRSNYVMRRDDDDDDDDAEIAASRDDEISARAVSFGYRVAMPCDIYLYTAESRMPDC